MPMWFLICFLLVGIGYVINEMRKTIQEIERNILSNNSTFRNFLIETSKFYDSNDIVCRDEILSAVEDLKDLTNKIDEVTKKIKVIQKEAKNKKANK